MSEYPIIKIPSVIEEAKSALPPSPPPPEPPVKPDEEPKKWEFTALTGAAFGTFITIVWFPQWFVIAMILIIAFVMLHRFSYQERLINHRKEIEVYLKNLQIYEDNKCQYERQSAMTPSPEETAAFQHSKLLEVLENTSPPDRRNETPPIGRLERYFGDYLTQYFSCKIHDGLELDIPKYQYPYTADFAYIDPSLNLHIDIEIDEPYAYMQDEAHIPTHYQESWKDNKRNEFFLSKTWVVIRFSEEQIARHPHSCCKTIAKVLCELLKDESYLSPFVNIPDLRPMRQWTHEEAQHMADTKYRKTYLPRSYR